MVLAVSLPAVLLRYAHRHEIFEEYTRRQYLKHHPELNPFGDEEEPTKFNSLDTVTKIRVLAQLSQWTLVNADRLRERMSETKDAEQIAWVCLHFTNASSPD